MLKDKRKFYRHPIDYPIQIIEDSMRAKRYHTTNISFGGICAAVKRNYERGKEVTVLLPVGNQLFRMKGKIAYCVKRVSGISTYHTGIAFIDNSSLFMVKMAEEFISIQKYQQKLAKKKHSEVSEEEAATEWVKKNAKRFAKMFDAYHQPREENYF